MFAKTKSSNPRYAMIEARWNRRPAKCFTIAYQNEEALRDVIAGPSTITWGVVTPRTVAVINELSSATNRE
jgi:hypothetical protein